MLSQRRIDFVLQLNLAVALLGGLLVLWTYLSEPSEPGSAVFFGLSYLRLALIAVVLLILLAILGIFFGLSRSSWQASIRDRFLSGLVHRKEVAWILIVWMAIAYVLLFLSEQQLGSLASYRQRLFPILLWFTVLAAQFSLLILYLRGTNLDTLRDQRPVLIPALAILVLLGLLLLTIGLTRFGLTPDQIYWQEPGVPILLHQVFFATFTGILFYLFLKRINLEKSNRVDLFIFLSVWGIASLAWLSQPARLTHFSLEPTPPNYQIYPFSDALLYDHTARAYLVGKPIPSDFWAKPLYSFFLTILHAFAGADYDFLIALQVVLLAVIPAFSYLLGARLGSRPAGLMLASLLILRERNALALSNVIEVSHVKLLLSDVFAMGFMVILLWLFFHWMEEPGERRGTPLVLGGILSLLVLTRGHPVLLLPFLLCVVFLGPVPSPRLRWEAVGMALLGFAIPLIPWFWRNYQFAGTLAFQYPVSPYSAQMSSAYSSAPGTFDPTNLPPRRPDESDFAYYDRLQGQAIGFALDHPDQVAMFVSAHYFHNLIFSYIYLPHSFQIEDIREYVRKEHFWGSWQGELSFQGIVLLLINFSVLALGFGYLWKKYKYLALVPLLLGVGYNLSISIGRISGWRFILPADWITLIYYSLGLMQLYHLLRALFTRGVALIPQESGTPKTIGPVSKSSLIMAGVFFLGLGLILTKGHELFSQRYPAKSVAQLREDYSKITNTMPSAISNSQLADFLAAEDAVILYGQALHPSFLTADEEGFDISWPVYVIWPGYKPRPFSRLIFNLVGPTSLGVVLPMESPPASFPDGAKVIVIGCLAQTGEVNAVAVLLQGPSTIHYLSEPLTLACPLLGLEP